MHANEKYGVPENGTADVAGAYRILVVDDESCLCTVLRTLFQAEGYEVDTTLGAWPAFEIMVRHRVDVVVTNVRMAPVDGLAMTERIRQEFPGTAVIIFSGYTVPAVCRRAAELGASDIIPKPASMPTILHSVRKAAVIGPDWRSDVVQAILAGCSQAYVHSLLCKRVAPP